MPPRMHRLTLAFDDDALERAFRDAHSYRWRSFAVATLIAVAPTWAAVAAWQWIVLPANGPWALRLVLGWVLPIFVVGLAVTRAVPERLRARAIRVAGPAMSLAISLAVVALPFGVPPPVPGGIRAGMAVILLTAFTFAEARFAARFAVAATLVAAWELATKSYEPVTRTALVDDAFWILLGMIVGAYVGYTSERQRRRIFLQRREIDDERARSEALLRNVLPEAIAERLKRSPERIAEHFDEVTVLFGDIAGFTPLSAKMSPAELVTALDVIFSRFDDLAQRLGLEKIKTIGDAYMVVGGLPTPRADHAEAVAEMALAMREAVAEQCFADGSALAMRIGIHTGPVVAGVIGKKKFSYDLWGDTGATRSTRRAGWSRTAWRGGCT